ncbi:DUF6181 family protein [Streptomyces sp. NPDC056773]|uniref:DUF6181 family protein n=1 Tax=unclassified Streptomyces TaxID=2593676 RepID=UPI003695D57A
MPDTQDTTGPSRGRRGAAQPSKDGVARIAIPLHPRLSASELARVLIAAPQDTDLTALTAIEVRAMVATLLTQHGYEILKRAHYVPLLPRHQDARRAIRRAYGSRFADAPSEQSFLAEPLSEILWGQL